MFASAPRREVLPAAGAHAEGAAVAWPSQAPGQRTWRRAANDDNGQRDNYKLVRDHGPQQGSIGINRDTYIPIIREFLSKSNKNIPKIYVGIF